MLMDIFSVGRGVFAFVHVVCVRAHVVCECLTRLCCHNIASFVSLHEIKISIVSVQYLLVHVLLKAGKTLWYVHISECVGKQCS